MLNLPQALTQSQAKVRAEYWARKRTDSPDGFCVYYCEDEEAFYVIPYAQSFDDGWEELDLVDIVEVEAKPDDEAIRLAMLSLDC